MEVRSKPRRLTQHHFGARLADLRKSAGLTQADVAQRLDTAPETVSRIERGIQWTDFETLSALAKMYGVSWAELHAVHPPGAENAKLREVQAVVDKLKDLSTEDVELVGAIVDAVAARRG